ncbi:hypothetical protein QUB08_29085 [Microcoleus sp. BR0-C5]|uniref:hypothetical protein n=1 Tax=Microcoleus sp. BR0-C5 TaxID=2818713 RepID=UPI002FD5BD9E
MTPGLRVLKLKPVTGCLRTLPVLVSQLNISRRQAEAWMIEDWLDEIIGIGTRFVDYEFRADAGKQIDPSVLSQFSDSIGIAPVRY